MKAEAFPRRNWTEEEDALLRKHYPAEGTEGVLNAGIERTDWAIWVRAKHLNVQFNSANLLGIGGPWLSTVLPMPFHMVPHRPSRITKALAQLAESNPTPAEYDRKKALILAS